VDESVRNDPPSEDQTSEDRERELRLEWNKYLGRLADLPTPSDVEKAIEEMDVPDSALLRPA
jgi:hypothetical protein